MSKADAPDWGAPIHGEHACFYRRSTGGEGCVAIPTAVALDAKGKRAPLSLTLFRRNDGADSDSAGRLDLNWRLDFPDLGEVERGAGRRMPRPITKAVPEGGSFRLYPMLDDIDLPESLRAEIHLSTTGRASGPAIHRIEAHDAGFMVGLLQGQTMPVGIIGQVGVMGLSPRFKARVTLDRGRTIAALRRLATRKGDIPDRELVEFLEARVPAKTEIDGEIPRGVERRFFGEALRDRIARALLTPTTPKNPETGACWRLREGEERTGTLTFNLAKETLCLRIFASRFDVNTALAGFEPNELVKHKTVDAVPRHGRTITVLPNLPLQPSGVLDWGIHIHVPPAAPHRPQAINKTLSNLSAEVEPIELDLMIGPDEDLAYEVRGYAVTMRGSNFAQLEGEPVTIERDILVVGPDLVPVATVGFEASARLLDAGSLSLHVGENAAESEAIAWTKGHPGLSIWLDTDEAGAYRVELSDGERSVVSQPFAPTGDLLDFDLFTEFGSRSVDLVVELAEGEHCAIDVRGESEDEHTTVAFSSSRMQRTFEWFCSNPLLGEVLVRRHGNEEWQSFPPAQDRIDLTPLCQAEEPA